MAHSSFQAFADCYNKGGRQELTDFYASDAKFMGHGMKLVVGREGKFFILHFFVALFGTQKNKGTKTISCTGNI